MAKRERSYTWFLEPKNEDINGQIAAEIVKTGEGDGVAYMIMCADGTPRNLVQCNEQICKAFALSRKLIVELNVFRKEGRNGLPQNVNFLFRKNKPRKLAHTGKQKATR